MTRPDFFPDLAFGWVFYSVLVSLLVVATVVDFRRFTIPKTLTITCFALGVLFNLGRGLWLGLQDKEVWKLSSWLGNGPAVGILDGLLFSLAGFGAALVLFVGLWKLKVCGGGDVKLFAAVGAWVGPWYFLMLLIGSVFMHVLVAMVFMAYVMLSQGFGQTRKQFSASEIKQPGRIGKDGKKVKPKHRGMTYSFPLTVATAVIMLVLLASDLGIGAARGGNPVAQGGNAPATQDSGQVRE